MDFLGQDIVLLSKNDGHVNKITNGALVDEPLLDVTVANKRERGLLGITSVAEQNGTQYIFLYYTESRNNDGSDICDKNRSCDKEIQPVGNALYRYEVAGEKLLNPELLLRIPALPGPSHNGGAISIGPDNYLYLAIGDIVGWTNKSSNTTAQNIKNGTDPDSRAGILRIGKDGNSISQGILGNRFPLNLYYAYGIRNSFGIDFDPISGNLWDTENGPAYGDEINLVKPGFNSGWGKVQGLWEPAVSTNPGAQEHVAGKEFLNYKDLVDFGGKGTYSSPEFIWKNPVGVTDLIFFNSDKLGEKYRNDLFVGCVRPGTIFHFELNAERTGLNLPGNLKDKIADSPDELDQIVFGEGFGGVTDLDIGPDGNLYILSYKGETASIYKITSKET
jgi:glucose/arabinose dehydrogenase